MRPRSPRQLVAGERIPASVHLQAYDLGHSLRMDIRTQSALLAAIVGLALGVSMLLAAGPAAGAHAVLDLRADGRRLLPRRSSSTASSPPTAYPWVPRIAVGASSSWARWCPSAALAFFLEFLGVSPSATRYGRRLALLSAVLGLAVGAHPAGRRALGAGRGARSGCWARCSVLGLAAARAGCAQTRVAHRARAADVPGDRRRRGDPLLRRSTSWRASSVPFPTLGPVVSTLYLFFLAQTLLRLRLMDLHELLGKIASQTVLAADPRRGLRHRSPPGWSGNRPLFLFNTVVAAFVMLILLEPLRAKVEERVVAIFFRERFELLRSARRSCARAWRTSSTSPSSRRWCSTRSTRRAGSPTPRSTCSRRTGPGYRLLDTAGPQPVALPRHRLGARAC